MAEKSINAEAEVTEMQKTDSAPANAGSGKPEDATEVKVENVTEEGTNVSVEEVEEVKPHEAEAKRPKAVPKKERRGNKALIKELELTRELAEGNKEKYTRLLAEFDNMRERNDRENKKMFDYGAKNALEKLLPVVDNFERALAAVSEDEKTGFEQGIEMIYKQLMEYMQSVGVTPMNAEGQEFNPDFHNAVIHVEDENYGENVIVEEMQKGYMYKDTVLRHAMVKVAN